ncbi:hypothetical protein J4438_03165 [Candidatus Woesearchaeota archaeon]|nr:hypothetical protein [Candidatus Woesearchaeota archaeon]
MVNKKLNLDDPVQAEEYLRSINPLELDSAKLDSAIFVKLAYLSRHQEKSVRSVANQKLYLSNDPDARIYLEELAKNKDEQVRLSAQGVLYHDDITSLIKSSQTREEPRIIMATRKKPGYDNTDLVLVPGSSFKITKFPRSIGKSWNNTHLDLHKQGLRMPPTRVFIPHYIQVIKAMQGLTDLLDGNMGVIKSEEVEKIYNKISNIQCRLDDYINMHGELETDHRVYDKELYGYTEPLERCFDSEESGLADLHSLNRQGFPTRMSDLEDHVRGENIKFIPPKKDSSTLFISSPKGDSLICTTETNISNPTVGSYGYVDN